jgi:hypothetical protein
LFIYDNRELERAGHHSEAWRFPDKSSPLSRSRARDCTQALRDTGIAVIDVTNPAGTDAGDAGESRPLVASPCAYLVTTFGSGRGINLDQFSLAGRLHRLRGHARARGLRDVD